MARKTKVVLIGYGGCSCETDSAKLTSYSWGELHKIQNLRDNDHVVISVLGDGRKHADWAEFYKRLSLEVCMEMLASRAGFTVIGDPRFDISIPATFGESSMPFLHWTGHVFEWDRQPGDIVTISSETPKRLRAYMQHLTRWEYSLGYLKQSSGVSAILAKYPLSATSNYADFGRTNHCWNRSSNALAFDIQAVRAVDGKSVRFGTMTFLPPISLSDDETISLVLREFFGFRIQHQEPEWLASHTVPGEEAVNKELELKRSQMERIGDELRVLEVSKKALRQPLKLLYADGSELEQEVRMVLRKIGAEVEDPTEPGNEDGWMKSTAGGTVREYVLEIKGCDRPGYSAGGLRQVMEWRRRGVQQRLKDYKGVFIGNNSRSEPLDSRVSPFGDDWVNRAKLYKVAGLRAEDLYRLYCLNEDGELDRDAFWEKLFATDGPFDLDAFLKENAIQ